MMADNLDIDVGGNTDYRKLLALQLMQPQPAARSFGEGLLQGLRGAAGAGMLMYQGQQDEEKRKKLADAIANSGGDIEALKTTAPDLYGKIKLQQALKGDTETYSNPTEVLNPNTNKREIATFSNRTGRPFYTGAMKAPDNDLKLPTAEIGNEKVTYRKNPSTGEWEEFGRAPRDPNPPLTTGVGPDGKPIRVLDRPGVPAYEKPPQNMVEIENADGTVTRVGGGGQNPDVAGRRQFAKDAAGNFAKDQSELHKRYDAALTAKETISELLAVIGDREVGKFTSLTNTAKAYANSLGANFDETKIGDLQQAEQMANTFALNALKSMGGNDTEFEYKKQLEFSPGPDNTRRRLDLANKSIELQAMQVAAEAKEMARIAGLIENGANISFSEAQQHMREFRRASGEEKIKLFRDYAESARKQK